MATSAATVEAGDLAAPTLEVTAELVVGAAVTGALAAGRVKATERLEAGALRAAGVLDAATLSAATAVAVMRGLCVLAVAALGIALAPLPVPATEPPPGLAALQAFAREPGPEVPFAAEKRASAADRPALRLHRPERQGRDRSPRLADEAAGADRARGVGDRHYDGAQAQPERLRGGHGAAGSRGHRRRGDEGQPVIHSVSPTLPTVSWCARPTRGPGR